MKHSVSPRLRTPTLFAAAALVVLLIGGAINGWNTLIYIIPIPIAIAVALYVLGEREGDAGDVIRKHVDERQAYERLKVQALVGRVLSIAVAVAYFVASASKTVLWPWAILLGLMVVSFLTGWLIYGEHGPWRSTDQTG